MNKKSKSSFVTTIITIITEEAKLNETYASVTLHQLEIIN